MSQPQTTPVLPSTADTNPYVPISWMAVSAAAVTGFYVILLLVLGFYSIRGKVPLLFWQLFVFPIVGVVLSFAARRTIRNAEGTRTGENLANLAWWGAVVGGFGYGAYYLGIEYAIRRDAADEASRWVMNIIKDDPANPSHPGLCQAFNETLEPDRRRVGSDAPQLQAEFHEQFVGFLNGDLIRLVQRNPGDCRFEDGGVKQWANRPYGIECQYGGTLKCREGVFPLQFSVKGVESGIISQAPGRKWIVTVPPSGVFVQEGLARTPYGWMVELLDQSGLQFAKDFFSLIGTSGPNEVSLMIHEGLGRIANTASYQVAYQLMRGQGNRSSHWLALARTTPGRMAAAGGPAGFAPFFTKESTDYFRTGFFKLPNGGEPTTEQKEQFAKAWETLGLLPPGTRMKGNAERIPLLSFGDNAFQIRLPCELPLPGQDTAIVRCRLVLELTDRAVIDEWKRLRESANPDQVTNTPPDELRARAIPWRLLRVETDLSHTPTGGQRIASKNPAPQPSMDQ